ncbi:MAG TPA: hypothetical protein VMR33_05135 [Candidatus Baltobacteraceae bacterium]|jgi:hypothetical protein|nr:hypothetical protein [Candidatus Baltobacteraceae bacterium]
MKAAGVCILLQVLCAAGYSENLRFKQFGTPIPARADLDVRWNGPSNAFPAKLWIYHLLPAKFSAETIGTLTELGSFTDKDRTDSGATEMRFRSADKARSLYISFPLGVIDYEGVPKYNPTNLVEDIPSKETAVDLTRQLLPKLGVRLSDIDKEENSPEPAFHVGDSAITFFVNGTFVSNIVERRVGFRRAVDGASFLSAGSGGDGDVKFGDHGKIVQIYISWRGLDRDKSCPTVTLDKIVESIRKGQAVQGLLPSDAPGIDWPKVKSITIKKAWPCYYAGNPLAPSDWLYPFAALSTTVDTGRRNVDVEIDCPIIEEAGE